LKFVSSVNLLTHSSPYSWWVFTTWWYICSGATLGIYRWRV